MLEWEVGGESSYTKSRICPIYEGGGVTIGIGYDLGYCTKEQIIADWSGILSQDEMDGALSASGITGPDAKRIAQELSPRITVSWDEAKQVFERGTLPRIEASTLKAFPNLDKLPRSCQVALISLVYNRGSSILGERRREMKAIRDAMVKEQFELIPTQLRAMKRLWPDLKGLQSRREGEVVLFELGLQDLKTAQE